VQEGGGEIPFRGMGTARFRSLPIPCEALEKRFMRSWYAPEAAEQSLTVAERVCPNSCRDKLAPAPSNEALDGKARKRRRNITLAPHPHEMPSAGSLAGGFLLGPSSYPNAFGRPWREICSLIRP
jgi:hypothetical protein